jgi:Xaa-Pro aminopeptidase
MTVALPDRAALPPMDVASRSVRLRERLGDAGCDALLVTKLVNIRYLTGFTGSAALLLVTPEGLLFVSDGRYGEQAAEQLGAAGVEARIEITSDEQKEVVSSAATGIARLGLEADSVTWAAQRTYATDWLPGAELVPTEGVVAGLRQVKDAGEIARIEAAAAFTDAALARVLPLMAEHPTEAEFGLALDSEIRRLGADGTGYETIVAGGPNGAKPHHRPGPRRIEDGDLVVIDVGGLVDGYTSDMTRTYMVGQASETQQRMIDVVTASQAAGVAAVRAGADCKAVDQVCRDHIAEAGWADAFLHGTGHALGLEIHEQPRFSKAADATVTAGCVMTVEPGVYLPEHGGVRVEDTVLVTEDGCRPLTHTPKTNDPNIQRVA